MSLRMPKTNPIRTAEEAEAAYQADIRELRRQSDKEKMTNAGVVGAITLVGLIYWYMTKKG